MENTLLRSLCDVTLFSLRHPEVDAKLLRCQYLEGTMSLMMKIAQEFVVSTQVAQLQCHN